MKLPKPPAYRNPLEFITRHNRANFKKALEYAFGWWLMCALRFWVLAMPLRFALELPAALACLFSKIPFKRKKLVRENLKRAFPEISDEMLNTLLRKIIKNASRSFLELFLMERYNRAKVAKLVEIKGAEHLEFVKKQGRGAIIVSAHFGTFTYGAMKLASLGYDVALLSKSQKDPVVDWYFKIIRLKQNIADITEHPINRAIREIVKLLKNKGVLYFQFDQRAPAEQADTIFFGYPVHTYHTPVKFARKTKAAILPAFMRYHGAKHILEIFEPVALGEQIETAEQEQQILQKLTSIIEAQIRKRPDLWWWFHNRWHRYRP